MVISGLLGFGLGLFVGLFKNKLLKKIVKNPTIIESGPRFPVFERRKDKRKPKAHTEQMEYESEKKLEEANRG